MNCLNCLNCMTYTTLLMDLQYKFNKSVCDEIYTLNSSHIYEKWMSCNGNLLDFINRLDNNNRLLLVKYITK